MGDRERRPTPSPRGCDEALDARVVAVNRLTPTIVEVVVRAPFAAQHFRPGQFYRLQNFERLADEGGRHPADDGGPRPHRRLGRPRGGPARHHRARDGQLLAAVRRACARRAPVVLMGPTGSPTEIPRGETVLLAGGGLGNAVLFSIGRALKAGQLPRRLLRRLPAPRRLLQEDEIEAGTDVVVWSVDAGPPIAPRRAAGPRLPRQHRAGDGGLRPGRARPARSSRSRRWTGSSPSARTG